MICEIRYSTAVSGFPAVKARGGREATTGNAFARLAGEGPYTILYPRRKLKSVINEKGGSPLVFMAQCCAANPPG